MMDLFYVIHVLVHFWFIKASIIVIIVVNQMIPSDI